MPLSREGSEDRAASGLEIASPVLDRLSHQDRALLLDRAVRRHLAPNERLYLAGDRARRAHIIASGLIKLVARDGEGRETILCLALVGEVTGDTAAIDGLPQPFDAVAATHTDVLGFDADLFIEVLKRNPAAALQLSLSMAERLRWIYEAALERTSSEVPARLAGRLLDLADILGHVDGGAVELELPLGQGDLARLAGMCRESACKTLRRFKAQGLVDYRGRRLRILRPDALERIKCAGRGT
jgi:CRP/FNR family transcriptional regulator, cyclic AMP receptor protein